MKSFWFAALAAIVAVGLTAGTAEAKRLGGGSSFGGKSSYSQPQKSTAAQDTKPQNGASTSAPAATAPAQTKRGLGGMLGGLMMGGLLGALFFGGAFENINFFDILVFAGLAFAGFMLFRHFAARRAPQYATSGGYGASPADSLHPDAMSQRSGTSAPVSTVRPGLALPAGFEAEPFLEGARRAYMSLQKAWDEGALADLRELTTDKVFAEIQDQFRTRSGENRTEVNDVQAQLLEVKEADGQMEASVLFNCMLAEHDAHSPVLVESKPVQEVWHFVRAKSSLRPTWLLDGIQQMTE